MARSVPLSRFTSQVGGGSAFFVRRHENLATDRSLSLCFNRRIWSGDYCHTSFYTAHHRCKCADQCHIHYLFASRICAFRSIRLSEAEVAPKVGLILHRHLRDFGFWRICVCVFPHYNQLTPSNKSLQATRDGAFSSASRFTLVGPACLSSGR